MTWLPVVCGALAVALLVPSRLRAPGIGPERSGQGLLLGGAVVGLLVVLAPASVAVLAGLGAAAVGGGAVLWRGRDARRAATEVSSRVLETCELLAAELAAGRPPGAALDRAAQSWPPLAPVAESFRVGADVPTALRQLATAPGARDLRLVAAAWQVAHRTGHGLGEAVERVAEGLRAAEGTRRIVEGELASARATARLVAGLPVLALAMGSGAGGDPWGFLVGQPLGLACLAGGLGFGFVGLWWIEAIARDVDRSG